MQGYEYEKVILYSYPHLEAIAQAVEEGARNKALLSFRSAEDTLSLLERISEDALTARELRLLKAETEEILLTLSEEELYLLEYKYFRRRRVLKGKFAGFALALSERSYFRRQNELLRKISSRMRTNGLTSENFSARFGRFSPFMRALRALESGLDAKLAARRKRCGLVFRRQKSGSASSSEAGERLPRKRNTATATSATQPMQIMAICTPVSPPAGSSGFATISSDTAGTR